MSGDVLPNSLVSYIIFIFKRDGSIVKSIFSSSRGSDLSAHVAWLLATCNISPSESDALF